MSGENVAHFELAAELDPKPKNVVGPNEVHRDFYLNPIALLALERTDCVAKLYLRRSY